MADAGEAAAIMAVDARLIMIVANLWEAQRGEKATATATTASSQAVQLHGLALKRRQQEARQETRQDTAKLDTMMGANAQVALDKFIRYFEVEAGILPLSEKSHYCLDPVLHWREHYHGLCYSWPYLHWSQ